MPLLNKQVNYDILGAFIGASEGTDFINHIPVLTRDNIRDVGNAILDYQPAKEAFYNSFLTKITRQLFENINANNVFKFLKGPMTEGDIEDAYIDYIKPESFDGGETNPFTHNKPDIKVLYHKIDRQLKYKVTVSDAQLRKAFLSDTGLSTLINKIVDTLTQSAEHDEYVMFKQLLLDCITYRDEDGILKTSKHVVLSGASKSELVERFLYEMKKHSMNMTFNTREYNNMGVLNKSSYDDQIIAIHKDYALDIDMGVLANTFNVDKMKLDGKVIIVDNFNDNNLCKEEGLTPDDVTDGGKRIVGCIFDRRGVRFWDSLRTMETLRNPDALYTNYWLHIWQGLSYAYFHNIFYILEPDELDTEE